MLYVGNHRSYFDILLTSVRAPRPTGYVAKIEMLRYPLLRNWMRNIRCTFLDRKDVKGMKTILDNIALLKTAFPSAFSRRAPETEHPHLCWNSTMAA